ncbi:HAD hydrolase family protein [candidate division WOR-3 bacterium]|nr:HAD hydrolase family protein [candidate division WOR-3 bacterium]
MPLKKVLGVDLHGTLLDKFWKIDSGIALKISKILFDLKRDFRIYVCSGNDLEFAKEHIPAEIFENTDGLILETGCVYSDGKTEKILVEEKLVKAAKDLELRLRRAQLKGVKYFARRLCTVSLFTRDEFSGEDPECVFDQICEFLDKEEEKLFYATHSDVAVDVVPEGYDKFTGLETVARGREVFAIADSYNDVTLLEKSDYSFAPKNLSPKALRILEGRKKISFLTKTLEKGVLYTSGKYYGDGVSEILETILLYSKNS